MTRTLLTALMVLAVAASARAQTTKHISVAFGAGSTVPVATDDYGSRPIFTGSARFDISPRVAFEGEVAQWGRDQTTSGGPGRNYTDFLTNRHDSTWAAAFNLLAHSRGRVSVFGGGGLGFGATDSATTWSYVGCTAAGGCGGSSSKRHGSGLTAQAVGGIDVGITERLAAFVSSTARSGYLYGPHQLNLVAGIRVRLR